MAGVLLSQVFQGIGESLKKLQKNEENVLTPGGGGV
jgi:hypothetical protein